jgi:predicted alpha/beta-hydrolase family hydrolase
MIREVTLRLPEKAGEIAALLLRPRDARWLLVLAHGAGAGMHHPFMEGLACELASAGVATLRYQFPYMQKRSGRPDPPAVLVNTVRVAIAAATDAATDLPLLAGGKSLGGRMTSLALSEELSNGKVKTSTVRGLIFFGFPLHPSGRPGTQRADHLERVNVPMLFLQGTRDTLADLAFLRPVCARLAPRAALHIVDTADHSFHVLKRSGITDADVIHELSRTVASWADTLHPEIL